VQENPRDVTRRLDPASEGGLVKLDVCMSVVAQPHTHGHHEWQVIAYDTIGQRSHVLASYPRRRRPEPR